MVQHVCYLLPPLRRFNYAAELPSFDAPVARFYDAATCYLLTPPHGVTPEQRRAQRGSCIRGLPPKALCAAIQPLAESWRPRICSLHLRLREHSGVTNVFVMYQHVVLLSCYHGAACLLAF